MAVMTVNAKKRILLVLRNKGFRMVIVIYRMDLLVQQMRYITESVVDLICWVSQQEQESI